MWSIVVLTNLANVMCRAVRDAFGMCRAWYCSLRHQTRSIVAVSAEQQGWCVRNSLLVAIGYEHKSSAEDEESRIAITVEPSASYGTMCPDGQSLCLNQSDCANICSKRSSSFISDIEDDCVAVAEPDSAELSATDWRHDYEHMRFFDQGSGGTSSLVRHKLSGVFCVKKVVEKRRWKGRYQMSVEAKLHMQQLQKHEHANINLLYSLHDSEMETTLILDYCELGDLLGITRQFRHRDEVIPAVFVMHVMTSMADALAFLHLGLSPLDDQGGFSKYGGHEAIIHRDIKLENIFLKPSAGRHGMPDVVLGDFGLACLASENYGTPGTPGYVAPEAASSFGQRSGNNLSQSGAVTAAGDVYSLGVTLFRLATKSWASSLRRAERIHERYELEDEVLELESSLQGDDCTTAKSLLLGCLVKTPELRCSTAELYRAGPELRAQMAARFSAGEDNFSTALIAKAPAQDDDASLPDLSTSIYSIDADEIITSYVAEKSTDVTVAHIAAANDQASEGVVMSKTCPWPDVWF